jgi:hypothetical protein
MQPSLMTGRWLKRLVVIWRITPATVAWGDLRARYMTNCANKYLGPMVLNIWLNFWPNVAYRSSDAKDHDRSGGAERNSDRALHSSRRRWGATHGDDCLASLAGLLPVCSEPPLCGPFCLAQRMACMASFPSHLPYRTITMTGRCQW